MRAMMLEPLSGDRTWTVLDGEAAPNLMTYLEVHPRLCRALVGGVRGQAHRPADALPMRLQIHCSTLLLCRMVL